MELPYTGETHVSSDGTMCEVLDTGALDFSKALFGRKTMEILVRKAEGGESVVNRNPSGAVLSTYVAKAGDAIFTNLHNPDDQYVPANPDGSRWTFNMLVEKGYAIVGVDPATGSVRITSQQSFNILPEAVEKPSCIKDAFGPGDHQFLFPGSTLKLSKNGAITGIDKSSFDSAWEILPPPRPSDTVPTAPPQSETTRALLADPIGVYENIDARIKKYGPLAPMPEFEPAVRYLQKELVHDEIIAYCQENSFAEAARQLALNALWHTDLEFEVSPYTGGVHQHEPPMAGRFPMQPTLKAIDEAVGFFDSFERATKRGHDYHYQLDRYRYHGLTIPHLSDWVVMPTNDSLSLKDLITVRSVPVGFTMTAARTGHLDAYFNSPLNGKIHDDNHSRRLRSENQGYFERENITTEEGKLEAYRQFNDTVQNIILPGIEIRPDMPEEEKNIRKAMTVLYFEWLHEYAKTPDRKTLIEELRFQPDGPSAFEVVLRAGETPTDIEKRRLENKNIESGAIFTHGGAKNKIYYFMDRGRNFLTSAYNKVTHGFFDNGHEGFNEAPPIGERSPELFAEAAMRIMRDFKINTDEICLPREKILGLLTNEGQGDKLGKNLETYPGHDPENSLNRGPRKVDDHKKSDAHMQGFLLG